MSDLNSQDAIVDDLEAERNCFVLIQYIDLLCVCVDHVKTVPYQRPTCTHISLAWYGQFVSIQIKRHLLLHLHQSRSPLSLTSTITITTTISFTHVILPRHSTHYHSWHGNDRDEKITGLDTHWQWPLCIWSSLKERTQDAFTYGNNSQCNQAHKVEDIRIDWNPIAAQRRTDMDWKRLERNSNA